MLVVQNDLRNSLVLGRSLVVPVTLRRIVVPVMPLVGGGLIRLRSLRLGGRLFGGLLRCRAAR